MTDRFVPVDLEDRERIVRREIDDGPASRALLEALEAVVGRDVDVADPPVVEYVDVDALDELIDDADDDAVHVCFGLWDRPVVVTPSEVRVYERDG